MTRGFPCARRWVSQFALILLISLLMPQPLASTAYAEGNSKSVIGLGLEWTTRNSGSTQWLRSVVSGDGDVAVVGDKGEILTSRDGVTWSSRRSGTTSNLTSVVYAGGRFVAVGQDGVAVTSADGSSWTAHKSGVTVELSDVEYGHSTFVAVGEQGKVLTSPDGATWTERKSGTSEKLYSIAYGGGQFVAVGRRGTVLTSTDGASWTVRKSGTTEHLTGVAYGNERFLAVGQNDTVLTSTDGSTWATHRVGESGVGLWSVTFGDGIFVAVGGAGNILATIEGETWARHDTGKTFSFLEGIGYVGGQFVAVGNFGTIRTSSDAELKPDALTGEAPRPDQPGTPAGQTGTQPAHPGPTTVPGTQPSATGIPQTNEAKLLSCSKGQVTGPRETRQAGGITLQADYAMAREDGKEELCGNITLNRYLKVDGSLTFDPKMLEVEGNGTLYLEASTDHFHGTITLFTGEFKANGDMTELIKESGLDELEVAGLKIKIKKLRLLGNGVQVGGSLELPKFLSLSKAVKAVDIDNLEIVDGQINVKGSIDLPDIKLGSSMMSLQKASISFDSKADTFKGKGKLAIPKLFTIEGSVGIKGGRLDDVGFGLDGLHLAIDTSGFYIKRIYGELDGLTDLSQLKITAATNIIGGPEVMGVSAIEAADLKLVVDMAGKVTGSGTLKLVELVQLKGELTYSWAQDYVQVKASMSAFDVIKANAELKLSEDSFYGKAEGKVQIPERIKIIGGRELASLGLAVDNDGFTGEAEVLGLADVAFQIDWKGNWDYDLNLHILSWFSYQAPIVAATGPFVTDRLLAAAADTQFTMPAGIRQAIVMLTWDAGDADFSLTTPDGRVITPADATMSSPTIRYQKNAFRREAIYVMVNPAAGTWRHTVTTRGATNYTVQLMEVVPAPTLTVTAPASDLSAAGPVTIRWQTNAPAGSKISLFRATAADPLGNRFATDLDASTGSYVWNPAGIPSGAYRIYALLDDGQHVPVRAEAAGTVTFANPEAPSVPRGLNARAANGRLELTWADNAEPDVVGYRLFLSPSGSPSAGGTAEQSVALGRVTEYTWSGLAAGRSYQLSLSAYDADDLESAASAPITVYLPVPAPPALRVTWPDKLVTNQKTQRITGQIEAGATGRIYRDDELLASGLTGAFDRAVPLQPGRNLLRVVAEKAGGDRTEESREYTYDATLPQLTVNGLTPQMSVAVPDLTVSGTAESGAVLTLNGKPVAITTDGTYSVLLSLTPGPNQVQLVLTDGAGNQRSFSGIVQYTGTAAKPCGAVFPDLPAAHPACRAVERLAGLKVLSGYPDGTFQPDRAVTRAEFAKMLVVALGRAPEPGGAIKFKDAGNHWGAKNGYLQAAVSLKAISGYPDGTFQPDAKVTRAQVVKIVAAAAGLTPTGTPPYADIPAEAWYAGWVAIARRANLIGPEAPLPVWVGTLFAGDEPATRAEAATILFNLLALKQ